MMTSDEYYNRKTVADYMDEELTSREGCRNLAVFIIIMTLLTVAATCFFIA